MRLCAHDTASTVLHHFNIRLIIFENTQKKEKRHSRRPAASKPAVSRPCGQFRCRGAARVMVFYLVKTPAPPEPTPWLKVLVSTGAVGEYLF